jgi:hypothetical protein
MRKLDPEEIILKMLYAEAIRHGAFYHVTAKSLGIERGEFGKALWVLQMRGLIEGCQFSQEGVMEDRDGLLLTAKGFEKIESTLGSTNNYECLERLREYFNDNGEHELADRIAEWLD